MAKAQVTVSAVNTLPQGLKGARTALDEFQIYTKRLGNQLRQSLSIAGTIATVVASVRILTKEIKACVDAYSEAEKVTMRLNAVWKNVGDITGKSARDLSEYAEAMEKQTYFTGEAIKESALLLAATEALTEEGFDRAMQASMDLAAAMGEDVTSAASTLAKALEDPEAALNRLKTIGVTFTNEEKAQIKALQDANNTYEAQALILDKIEEKYQGVAQVINDTPVGTLDNIKDVLADIRENLGGALLNSITPALEALYGWLVKISNWVAEASDLTNVSNALKHGGDLTDFSSALLQRALQKYQNEIANPTNNESAAHSGTFQNWVNVLLAELDRREKATVINPIVTNPDAASGSADLTNVLGSFLQSYMPKDIASEYQGIIDTASKYLDMVTQAVPTSLNDMRSLLGLSAEATGADIKKALEDGGYTNALKSIIATFEGKLAALADPLTELVDSPTLTGLDEILNTYGKQSASYQQKALKEAFNRIAEVYEYASAEDRVYLSEILQSLEDQIKNPATDTAVTSILDKFRNKLKDVFENGVTIFGRYFKFFEDPEWRETVGFTDEHTAAAASATLSYAIESFGEAGELISELATNMSTMGPFLGAIVTALKYVIEGIAEVLGPVLNEFIKYGLEPLRELGRVIGQILLPILEDIMPLVRESASSLMGVFDTLGRILGPIISLISSVLTPVVQSLCVVLKVLEPVLKMIANAFLVFGGIISWLAQGIRHIVAVFANWLAGLELFGWRPFEGMGVEDPGGPGNIAAYIASYIEEAWQPWTAGNNIGMDSATETAISSASYRGATQVTINIYAEGPFVGDGGMREFARMIRDEFDALSYYGVTT